MRGDPSRDVAGLETRLGTRVGTPWRRGRARDTRGDPPWGHGRAGDTRGDPPWGHCGEGDKDTARTGPLSPRTPHPPGVPVSPVSPHLSLVSPRDTWCARTLATRMRTMRRNTTKFTWGQSGGAGDTRGPGDTCVPPTPPHPPQAGTGRRRVTHRHGHQDGDADDPPHRRLLVPLPAAAWGVGRVSAHGGGGGTWPRVPCGGGGGHGRASPPKGTARGQGGLTPRSRRGAGPPPTGPRRARGLLGRGGGGCGTPRGGRGGPRGGAE